MIILRVFHPPLRVCFIVCVSFTLVVFSLLVSAVLVVINGAACLHDFSGCAGRD